MAELRGRLIEVVGSGNWPLLEPLPVTRFLGGAFGVSNVSAYRVLSELAGQGLLWRAPNGRYFQAGARKLLDRPLPVACLFRRLERWSELSRHLLEGADAACGDLERALLLVHDRALFHQSDPDAPTREGTDAELHRNLEDFLNLYGERTHGILLDELWPDRILTKFRGKLHNAVMLHRRTSLGFLGCVSPDFSAVARMVLAHTNSRGFDRMLLLLPSNDYEPARQMAQAIELAAGWRAGFLTEEIFHPSDTFARRLGATLGSLKTKERLLLVATEDNLAVSVLEILRQKTVNPPWPHGLLSTMGTRIAQEKQISCVVNDFRKMGELATRMAISGELGKACLPPDFFQGVTT